MDKLLLVLCTLLIPLAILRWQQMKLIDWLSPVVCCYMIGIGLGNFLTPWWDQQLARELSEISVLLALPLLLFSTNLIAWFKLARPTLISFGIVIFSVMTVSFTVGKFLAGDSEREIWKLAGMMVGVYTGGTPNLMAIGKALGVKEEAFIMVNAVDVVLGGFYLLFIMTVGVKILSRFLRPFDQSKVPENNHQLTSWTRLDLQQKMRHAFVLIILGGLAVALALLLSQLLTGGENVSVIILGLTTIAVMLSFIPKIRHFEGSQEIGQYLLLVFCVAVGSLANAAQLVSGSLWYFLFCGSIMLGSILLHFLCCFLLKIDRDTAIITSMAGIFGPAFVAPMSQVLKNKSILFSGVTTALVGYAVGNFIGILIAHLVKGF
jgi:uncharacterized membrane protein